MSATSVIWGAAPSGSTAARVHVTSWATAPHDQPSPVADTNDTAAGSVSVTTVSAPATEGPSLTTSRVHVTRSPGIGSRACRLSIRRSADAVTVALSLSVLLAGTGS